MLTQAELLDRRQAAKTVLKEAGKRALKSFRARDFQTETKGTQDFVSAIDRTTEALIRNRLLAQFPEDGFLGEEGGGHLSGTTWIIDPIDGTSNFVRGISFWCLSAALVVDDRAVIGIIYDPNLDEMFSAHADGGCTLNDSPIQISGTTDPTRATLGISFNFQKSKDPVGAVVAALIAKGTSFRMMGAGALSLAHCAAGRTDGFWEAHMQPWDAAAGLVLVAEAGGSICDYSANDGFVNGNAVLVSTPALASYFAAETGVPLIGSATHPAVRKV